MSSQKIGLLPRAHDHQGIAVDQEGSSTLKCHINSRLKLIAIIKSRFCNWINPILHLVFWSHDAAGALPKKRIGTLHTCSWSVYREKMQSLNWPGLVTNGRKGSRLCFKMRGHPDQALFGEARCLWRYHYLRVRCVCRCDGIFFCG